MAEEEKKPEGENPAAEGEDAKGKKKKKEKKKKKKKDEAAEGTEGAEGADKPEELEYEVDAEGKPVLDENGQPIPVKKKGKKKLIIIILLVVVLLGGGGAAAWFLKLIPHGDGGSVSEEEAALTAPQITYLDLEPFTVNLNNPGKQVSFLKMTVTLEVPNLATKNAVESKMPRIRDSFQVYLRELRSSDLQGSAGVHRLREELLLRINKAIEPDKINDILFKEIIVQ